MSKALAEVLGSLALAAVNARRFHVALQLTRPKRDARTGESLDTDT
jgi:hypothetical protein